MIITQKSVKVSKREAKWQMVEGILISDSAIQGVLVGVLIYLILEIKRPPLLKGRVRTTWNKFHDTDTCQRKLGIVCHSKTPLTDSCQFDSNSLTPPK